jgi:hypothetical protein
MVEIAEISKTSGQGGVSPAASLTKRCRECSAIDATANRKRSTPEETDAVLRASWEMSDERMAVAGTRCTLPPECVNARIMLRRMGNAAPSPHSSRVCNAALGNAMNARNELKALGAVAYVGRGNRIATGSSAPAFSD